MSTQTTFCLRVWHWFPVIQCIWHASSGQLDTYSKLSKSLNVTQPVFKKFFPLDSLQSTWSSSKGSNSRARTIQRGRTYSLLQNYTDLPLTFSPCSFPNVLICHINPESVKLLCEDKKDGPHIQPIFSHFDAWIHRTVVTLSNSPTSNGSCFTHMTWSAFLTSQKLRAVKAKDG